MSGEMNEIDRRRFLELAALTGASAAIGQELRGGDFGAADAIDGIHETELDGVGKGDAEVDVPRTEGRWSGGMME